MTSEVKKYNRITLDYTDVTVVAICHNPRCDWRFLCFDRMTAWHAAAEHDRAVHDGELRAAQNIYRANRRRRFRELQDAT